MRLTPGNWSLAYSFAILGNAYVIDSGGQRVTQISCSASCQATQTFAIATAGDYRLQINASGAWEFAVRPG
jgi:hypothetical protein